MTNNKLYFKKFLSFQTIDHTTTFLVSKPLSRIYTKFFIAEAKNKNNQIVRNSKVKLKNYFKVFHIKRCRKWNNLNIVTQKIIWKQSNYFYLCLKQCLVFHRGKKSSRKFQQQVVKKMFWRKDNLMEPKFCFKLSQGVPEENSNE